MCACHDIFNMIDQMNILILEWKKSYVIRNKPIHPKKQWDTIWCTNYECSNIRIEKVKLKCMVSVAGYESIDITHV